LCVRVNCDQLIAMYKVADRSVPNPSVVPAVDEVSLDVDSLSDTVTSP